MTNLPYEFRYSCKVPPMLSQKVNYIFLLSWDLNRGEKIASLFPEEQQLHFHYYHFPQILPTSTVMNGQNFAQTKTLWHIQIFCRKMI